MHEVLSHAAAAPGLMALILACVFVGAVVQASLGMGFGLVVAPLLAVLDPALVPAPTLWVGFFTATWGALSERAAIRWDEVRVAVAGRMLGVAGAVLVLSQLASRETFSVLFGLTIAAAVILSVAGWRLRFSKGNILAMGTVSGLMGTITSVGAPPLAMVYQSRAAVHARPTLAAFFAIGCALSLIGLYLSGWAGTRDFLLSLLMLPGMLAGTFAARALGSRFDRRYRPLLLALSGSAAVVLVIRGLG